MSLPLAALLLLAPPGAVLAQEASLRLAPSTPTVLIGAQFDISGVAELPEGTTLSRPQKGQDTGSFELIRVELGDPETKGGRTTRSVWIRTAAFSLGQQTFPSLEWPVDTPEGLGTLRSTPVQVTVNPPKPGLHDTGDIREIRAPFEPSMWRVWGLAALILAAAAAAAVLAYRRLRRRGKPGGAGPAPKPDKRTPEEIALDELAGLLGQGLPVKEFYDRLSDIVRLFIERRHGVPALYMTSYDLQRAMIRADLPPEARSLAKSLFHRCDMAKFARYLPAEDELDKDCDTGKRIVRLLSPGRAALKDTHDLAAGGRPKTS